MAIRRCFSKKIVRSDDFLDLPATTQLLYFQLGMEADDRGYINNARTVIKITGCAPGDLHMLVERGFVLIREETLILIRDWRINNTIQPTRLSETLYVEDLKKLFLDEYGSYSKEETPERVLLTDCRQIDNKVMPQDNLTKDKIIKGNLTKDNSIEDKSIQDNDPFAGLDIASSDTEVMDDDDLPF